MILCNQLGLGCSVCVLDFGTIVLNVMVLCFEKAIFVFYGDGFVGSMPNRLGSKMRLRVTWDRYYACLCL